VHLRFCTAKTRHDHDDVTFQVQVAWLSQNAEVLVSGSEATEDYTMQVSILPNIIKCDHEDFLSCPSPIEPRDHKILSATHTSANDNICGFCRSSPPPTWREILAGHFSFYITCVVPQKWKNEEFLRNKPMLWQLVDCYVTYTAFWTP
jgi:hypothetical protein